MTTDKFRLTRTPSDAVRMISDAIPAGEEQWSLVETTSGSRKEKRERTGDEHEKEKERWRGAGKERQRERRMEKDRTNPEKSCSKRDSRRDDKYASIRSDHIHGHSSGSRQRENVTGQLSRELLKFLISPAKLSIRQIQTEGKVLQPRMGKRAQELRKINPPGGVAGGKSDRTPLIIVLRM